MATYVAQLSDNSGASPMAAEITTLLSLGTTLTGTAASLLTSLGVLPGATAAAPPTISDPTIISYAPGTLTVTPVTAPDTQTFPAPGVTQSSVILGTAPNFDVADPGIAFPLKPTVLSPTLGSAPLVTDRTMPDAPDIVLPLVPTLRSIVLPDAPTTIMPTFTSVSPEAPEIRAPSFIWSETPYSPQLGQLATKIVDNLAFDFDSAEEAIWNRGQARIDRAANEQVLNLSNDIAARGFSLPTGVMLAAGNELRTKALEMKVDNANTAMIKAAELNTQKLVTALTTGVQYEGQWMSYQTQAMQRQFEAARMTVDIFMKVVDAEIALYNGRVQAYATDAQVYRDKIQAELAKVELYRTELEGQKIIGELNLQSVEIYKSMLQGVMTNIELYKSRISAVVASLEVDKARVEIFNAQVNAFRSQVESNVAQYNAWGEQMRGEAVKAQVYETEVRAFASRIESFRAVETTKIEAGRLQLASSELSLKAFEASLAGYDSYIRGYQAKITAESATNSAAIQAYGAISSANVGAGQVNAQLQGIKVDADKANALASLEHAHKLVTESQAQAALQIEAVQGAAKVYSQLAASVFSAVHFSESVNSSISISNALSESYNQSI